jgi:hypothetical protein
VEILQLPALRSYLHNRPYRIQLSTDNSIIAKSLLSIPCRTQLTTNSGSRPFHTNLLVFSSQNYFQLTTHYVGPFYFKVTPRHGPRRKRPFSVVVTQLLQLHSNGLHNTVSNSNSVVVEACLQLHCIATALVSSFVSRIFPNNGSIRHSIISRCIYNT